MTNTTMCLSSLTWYKVGYGRFGHPPVMVSLCDIDEAFHAMVKRRTPTSSFSLGRRGGLGEEVGVEPREKEAFSTADRCMVGVGEGKK